MNVKDIQGTVKNTLSNVTSREGRVAKGIESVTSRVPSDVFLWAGLGVLATALTLNLSHKKSTALFLEPLAPVLLLLGLYNKLVKIHGHDQYDRDPESMA